MKTTIFACLLALIAIAGIAQTPADAPSTPLEEAIFAASGKPTKASCSANCGGGTSVSCPGGTTSCSAVDRDCSVLQRGSVTCNGSTTFCPKTCHCEEVCVCAVSCLEPCTSGGGFVQECGSWGICATSCYCGGECLNPGDGTPVVPNPNTASAGACQTPADAEALRAAIFN